MKRIILVALVGLVLCAGIVYGNGKYGEIKPLIEKMGTAFENFILGLEKAEDANAIAAALDAFSKIMKDLAPKMREIVKKYPELKDEATHPEELKPLLKKMDEMGKKMIGLMGKIQQFANDPKVTEANKRFMEAMAAMKEDPKEKK
jgi:hypothetical protein